MKSMKNLFNPNLVAIFALIKEGKTGYEIVKNTKRLKKCKCCLKIIQL